MKTKLLFAVLTFFLIIENIKSQTPTWKWVSGGGSQSDSWVEDIATTKAGDNYITGAFMYSAQFGAYNLTTAGMQSMFIVKHDVNGNCLWAKTANTEIGGEANGYGVVVDNNGNIYVSGYFRDTVSFGPFTLQPQSSNVINSFLVKYDNNGNEIWAKQLNNNTTGYTNIGPMTIDKNNNLYILGGGNSPSFGTYNLPYGSCLLKVDSNGNIIYASHIGGLYVNLSHIALDANNNVFITGGISNTVTINNQSYTSIGKNDVLFLKVNANGAINWVKHYGTNNATISAYGKGITTDKNNNIYLSGYFGSGTTNSVSINFGSHILNKPNSSVYYPVSGGAFIVKCDNNGNELWAKQNLLGDCTADAIITDKFSNSYIVGYSLDTAVSFHPSTLLNFPGTTFTLFGPRAPFIVKFDPSGNYVFSKTISNGGGEGFAIGLDTLCGIYITGLSYTGPITFGSYSYTNPSQTKRNVFVAKSNGGEGNECNLIHSINSLNSNEDFKIYPNPANNFITIVQKNSTLKPVVNVYNLLGEIQKEISLVDEHNTIDISEFPNGVYLLEIISNNKISRQKFVKN